MWNEESYLAFNPDVTAAVKSGGFASGQDHYRKVGVKEGRRGGFSGWDEEGYLLDHPEVRNAVHSGQFPSGAIHWVTAGQARGYLPNLGNRLRSH